MNSMKFQRKQIKSWISFRKSRMNGKPINSKAWRALRVELLQKASLIPSRDINGRLIINLRDNPLFLTDHCIRH